MSHLANINLKYDDREFIYLIEYKDNDIDSYNFEYKAVGNAIIFNNGQLKSDLNKWKLKDESGSWKNLKLKSSKINIYFPDYSIETYKNGGKYVIDINTYIADTYISLGSFLINRMDSVAPSKTTKYLDQEYHEMVELEIPSPYDLTYSNSASLFRSALKGEEDYNDDCTNLIVTINPVNKIGEEYVVKNECSGGQNSVLISHNKSDYLHTELSYNNKQLNLTINYNKVYNNLSNYLRDTYKWGSKSIYIKNDLRIISASEGITERQYINATLSGNYIIDIKNHPIYVYLNDWRKYKDGMSFVCFTHVFVGGTDEENHRLCIGSNTIPITPELFSKLLIDNIDIPEAIKKEIDDTMKIEILNTIDYDKSVQKHVCNYTKSNRIIPIFYKVKDLGNLVIHPEVTENICINLDAYKSKVSSFILQIEGIKFSEFGVTNTGTIFKVIGERLPRVNSTGTYYILNQDHELVVSGKYKYEL